jgi:hypothetical protein
MILKNVICKHNFLKIQVSILQNLSLAFKIVWLKKNLPKI